MIARRVLTAYIYSGCSSVDRGTYNITKYCALVAIEKYNNFFQITVTWGGKESSLHMKKMVLFKISNDKHRRGVDLFALKLWKTVH